MLSVTYHPYKKGLGGLFNTSNSRFNEVCTVEETLSVVMCVS